MWTESLPAFAILTAAVAGCGLLIQGTQLLFNGGKPRRYRLDGFETEMLARDDRIKKEAQA